MVGSVNVNFPIRLEGLHLSHSAFVRYHPELFPGLIYKMILANTPERQKASARLDAGLLERRPPPLPAGHIRNSGQTKADALLRARACDSRSPCVRIEYMKNVSCGLLPWKRGHRS